MPSKATYQQQSNDEPEQIVNFYATPRSLNITLMTVILTEVTMSCRNLNGGFPSNLSVNGGFLIILPRVSWVFFAILGSISAMCSSTVQLNQWKARFQPPCQQSTPSLWMFALGRKQSEFYPTMQYNVSLGLDFRFVFRPRAFPLLLTTKCFRLNLVNLQCFSWSKK